jgi:RimJ/RimL family protein N-acetyltransferase
MHYYQLVVVQGEGLFSPKGMSTECHMNRSSPGRPDAEAPCARQKAAPVDGAGDYVQEMTRATPTSADETQRQPIRLRDVRPADIEVFYEQQLDDEATAMAAFPARDHDAHFAHWNKILRDKECVTKTIAVGEHVAGNIGSWIQDGHREIGYWIVKQYWGRGIATEAVRQFLLVVETRPLFAWVVRHNGGSIRVLEKAGFVFDRDEDDYRVYKFD